MPRKGTRKGARKASAPEKSREVPFRDLEGQAYALVTSMLGNGRLLATCEDRLSRMCKIRGSMRRSEWISVGDFILVGLREFQADTKADVLHRYCIEDVRYLRKVGELDAFAPAKGEEATAAQDEESLVVFEGDDLDVDML